MIPVARTENLLLQEVGNELIVYDQDNNSSHCLTPMAVRVWELSDGQNTVNDIAKQLEKEFNLPADSDVDMRGLVWLTLEELERYSLIKEYLKQPATKVIAGMSRRKAIKTATLVGGFAIGSMFPLVRSIVAPAAAQTISTNRKKRREECLTGKCTLIAGFPPTDGRCISTDTYPCSGDCECVKVISEFDGTVDCKCYKKI